jgi:ribose transport system substrate-binding protein
VTDSEGSGLPEATLTRRSLLGKAAAAGAIVAGAGYMTNPALAEAPASAEATALKTGTIFDTVATLSNNFLLDWSRGAKEASAALGLKSFTQTNAGSAQTQVAQFESQYARGIKMAVGLYQDYTSLSSILPLTVKHKARITSAQDIIPWTTPLDWQGLAFLTYFYGDDYSGAFLGATEVFKRMGGKGNVIYISPLRGSIGYAVHTAGFRDALKNFPNIKLLEERDGKWDRATANSIMRDLIVKHGNNINGVFCGNDGEALGAIAALDEAGMSAPVAGQNGDSSGLPFLQSGKMVASGCYIPTLAGGISVVRQFDALNGFVPKTTERMMYMGQITLTPDNVATYKKAIYGAGKLPFDWKKMSRVLHPKDFDTVNLLSPLEPSFFWKHYYPKPPSFKGFNPAWAAARRNGEFKSTAALYRKHYGGSIFGIPIKQVFPK